MCNSWGMDAPLPPAELRFIEKGGGDVFLREGDVRARAVLPHITDETHLLDVGSGYARLLYGLRRAGWRGRYTGIDVLKKHVRWCTENLADERTTFIRLDVANDRYNPNGAVKPSDVEFPPADVAVLLSVFTHMWPDDVAAYLRALRRALPVGGKVLATWFLDSRRMRVQRALGRTEFNARHRVTAHAVVMDPASPLHVIAIDERWVRRKVAAAGFVIESLEYGGWVRSRGPLAQDVTVLRVGPRR